jgi:hypothetical protein
MKRINQGWLCFLCASAMVMLVSCSPIPYLELEYRLPAKSEALKGKRVYVTVEDLRTNKDIIGKGARGEFENFSGNISFSVARASGPGTRVGIYDIPSLFKEAFIKRLEDQGAEVVPGPGKGTLELTLVLKRFLLDLTDREWKLKMAYELKLSRDGNVLSRQIVSGDGERLKLIGRDQADVLAGEVFTDLVNRADLIRLFRDAGL